MMHIIQYSFDIQFLPSYFETEGVFSLKFVYCIHYLIPCDLVCIYCLLFMML
ncbi:hypothetical protein K443DRAFT_470125 [Laccaria amethystina LaAM-08-1]|uniref:Uncharacterized protein n=1 Tax=Laccaria amethystina LaAM-08-1 TaxID=1095629 RepID=A0A0C9Y0V9_9AGAR|nr:hypothetical protein K443DRAFT_470125 [Laccaria amethystina LaAM-08-1]